MRHRDVSRSTDAAAGQPDVWGPHVSDTGLFHSLTGGTGQRPHQLGQLRRVGPLWLT